MPIFLAPVDEEVTIVHVHGDSKVKKHLQNLGIVEGQKVKVLSRETKAVIVQVKESRLALDRDVARAILIS